MGRMRLGAPRIARALDNLKTYSPLAAQVLEWAEANKVSFQETDMGYEMQGECDVRDVMGRSAIIKLNTLTDDPYERIIIHEMMHAVQHIAHNLLKNKSRKGDLAYYLLNSLSAEAGAETLTARVAYEMAENGMPEIYENLVQHDRIDKGFHTVQRVYSKTYNTDVGSGVTSYVASMNASCRVFEAYFGTLSMIEDYTEQACMNYMLRIENGVYDRIPIGEGFSPESAINCAKLADDFHLVAQVQIPLTLETVLKDMPRMRQFCEFLDFKRMERSQGENEVAVLRKGLEEAGNPFLELEIADILQAMEKEGEKYIEDQRYMIKVVSEMAGFDDHKQLKLDFQQDKPSSPASRAGEVHIPNQKKKKGKDLSA